MTADKSPPFTKDEWTRIRKALADSNWVQTRAAEHLGTTRRILRYRMEKLDIPAQSPDAADPADAPQASEAS